MNHKKDVKFESNRAYMVDPNVSKLFKPVAEDIITTAERMQLGGMQFEVLRERMEAKKRKEIAKKHGLSISTIQYYERAAIKKIAKIEPDLVKKLKEIMAMSLTEEGLKERKREYIKRYSELNRDKIRVSSFKYGLKNPEKRKRSYLSYYTRHRERILQKARERYRASELNHKKLERKKAIQSTDYLMLLKEAKQEIKNDTDKEANAYAKILRSNSSNSYKKEEAILAIGARHNRKAFRLLIKHLNSEVEFLKKAVIWSFGEQGEYRAVPYLLNLFPKSQFDIQLDIIRALNNIGSSTSLEALMKLKQMTGDPWLRMEIDRQISGFKFRDAYKEMRAKLIATYLKKLISCGVLTEKDYLSAYKIFSEVNNNFATQYKSLFADSNPDMKFQFSLRKQNRIINRLYLSKTSDEKVLKALMIIETLKEIWGGRFNHNRILAEFEKSSR